MLEDKDEDASVDDGKEGGVDEDDREEEEGERERRRRRSQQPALERARIPAPYPVRMHVSMYEPPYQRHPACIGKRKCQMRLHSGSSCPTCTGTGEDPAFGTGSRREQ